MLVKVHLLTQSEPVVHAGVLNAYQKGDLYCVMMSDRSVYKYPVVQLFRVQEYPDA